jgi:DNA-binding NtrC family response regulator
VSEERTVPHRVEGQPIRGLKAEVIGGPDSGKTFLAQNDTITVGTAPGNDLALTDDRVSRYHLELARRHDRIVVSDCGSTNGTAIGAISVERALIPAGTVLSIGRTSLRVSDAGTVTIALHPEDSLGRLRGRSPALRQLMARIERSARTGVSVLLLGETGTGKEVIAHAIHEASPRASKRFETVDCGALLPTLVASELFGHEQGAFTGADRQHIGAFERAHGGTLFLDEVGELPAALQAALLGALERRRFRRVGGSTEIAVDVRLVAATHRDLRAEVNKGSFRQDLYYRLAVLLLRVPPLRERVDDIPVLAQHFLREAGSAEDVDVLIPANVMKQLEMHHWPGNVRELRNLVEATLAMGEAPNLAETWGEPVASVGPSRFPEQVFALSYKDARARVLTEFEIEYVRRVMERAKGNAAQAARLAAMDRSYLFDLIKRHGLR